MKYYSNFIDEFIGNEQHENHGMETHNYQIPINSKSLLNDKLNKIENRLDKFYSLVQPAVRAADCTHFVKNKTASRIERSDIYRPPPRGLPSVTIDKVRPNF
jgi:hypothetical protein